MGIGVDVVDLARFSGVVDRTPGIIDRLFTKAEQTSAEGHQLPLISLAGRFAVKEAVAKALGAPAGLSWQDCEILIGERGKPYLELSGTVAAEAKRQEITNWHLSLSHDGNIATAFVIAEKQ